MLKARPCFLLPAPREFAMDPALLRERNRANPCPRRGNPRYRPHAGAWQRHCPVPVPQRPVRAAEPGRARGAAGTARRRGGHGAGGVTYREKQLLEPAQRGCGQLLRGRPRSPGTRPPLSPARAPRPRTARPPRPAAGALPGGSGGTPRGARWASWAAGPGPGPGPHRLPRCPRCLRRPRLARPGPAARKQAAT